MDLEFIALGIPAPQGSKKAFRRGKHIALVESCARVKPYRAAVAAAALAAGAKVLHGPIYVSVIFSFVRPKSHFNAKGELRDAATRYVGRPDIDKLCRAVLDSLTGIAWIDDSQVVALDASKHYGQCASTHLFIRPGT
jgi:crossover junction endodeoxyribonuclease RusA